MKRYLKLFVFLLTHARLLLPMVSVITNRIEDNVSLIRNGI